MRAGGRRSGPSAYSPHPRGNFGGSGRRTENDGAYSYVTLETDLDLTAHYAAQLEGVGWARTDGGHPGSQAWSSWTLTDEDGKPWTGTFTALRLPATHDRYLLQIHAGRTPNR